MYRGDACTASMTVLCIDTMQKTRWWRRHRSSRVVDVTNFFRELRYAGRRLWRRRVASAAFILTIGLVTGAATSVAAFVSATMIRPLSYPDGERLAALFVLPNDAKSSADRIPLRALDILRSASGCSRPMR